MYTIKVTDATGEWKGSETESVLNGAQRNGVKIPYACKGGGCGLCKIKVTEGEFERGPSSMAVLPESEREQNYTLACKTFPKGNLQIQIELSKQVETISS